VEDTKQFPTSNSQEAFFLRMIYTNCSFVLGNIFIGWKIFRLRNSNNGVPQLSNIVRVQGQLVINAAAFWGMIHVSQLM